jgi:hypothetical protein
MTYSLSRRFSLNDHFCRQRPSRLVGATIFAGRDPLLSPAAITSAHRHTRRRPDVLAFLRASGPPSGGIANMRTMIAYRVLLQAGE